MHVLSRVPNRQLLRTLFLVVGVFHMPIGLSLFYVNTASSSPHSCRSSADIRISHSPYWVPVRYDPLNPGLYLGRFCRATV